MARLLVFLGFLTGVIGIYFLSFYSHTPISNERFDLAKFEQAHKEEMERQHKASLKHTDAESTEEGAEGAAATEAAAGESLIELDSEELKNGYNVYTKTGKCVTCHGKNGEGKKSQQAPKIAGQHNWYLQDQLIKMKSKERYNAKMNPYLKNLNEKDFADVSLYLSKLPPQ